MFENMIIWGPQVADEHDTLIQLSEEDHELLEKELKGLDNKWGISLSRESSINSYQNDDYLFAAGLLQDVRDIIKKYIIMRIPQSGLEAILKFRTYIWILWNDQH